MCSAQAIQPSALQRLAGGEAGVYLVGRCKEHIGQGEGRSAPASVYGLLDALTEVSQEDTEASLFLGLGGVVGCPVLLVGNSDCPCLYGTSVRLFLAPDGILHGVDMLALHMPCLEVGATASRRQSIKAHGVQALPGLGRHQIAILPFSNPAEGRDLQTSLFACIHETLLIPLVTLLI